MNCIQLYLIKIFFFSFIQLYFSFNLFNKTCSDEAVSSLDQKEIGSDEYNFSFVFLTINFVLLLMN